jgi:chromosome segregation ATPase
VHHIRLQVNIFYLQLQDDLTQQNHTLQTTARKLNESEAVNHHLQRQQDEFKIALEQSASLNSNLKKQLEAKEEVLQSRNEENKQMQTRIDSLIKTVGTVNRTVQELCGQIKDVSTS